jgi:flagellar hook assembly protein FlgD
LSEAYPNPFNPSTSINLSIPEAGHVSVMVYNVMGQLVSTLADGQMDASDYSFTWDASAISSGVYLITATTANHTSTQKGMFLK